MKKKKSNSPKKGMPKGLRNRHVYIIGQHLFQNELIAFYLKREIDARCSVGKSPIDIDKMDINSSGKPTLILIESPDKEDLDIYLRRFRKGDGNITDHHLMALFNVNSGQGIEKKAISLGIKGIFYGEDPIASFSKGIEAIFNGELWISKEVLIQYVIGKDKEDSSAKDKKSLLTSREIEILAMIATGSTNEMIGERLFISLNTVKTHIYNIFKKIDVPNRLQAALWAARNF
jgi:DNA-binding NarL/FixJ family response regulator